MDYKKALKFYPDFPIKGVNFVDIIPLLQDKEVFRSLTRDLGALCGAPNIAAPEARGFLFAAPMLYGCDLVQVEIMKEYGPDHVYFRRSDLAASRRSADGLVELTFFDDILATGGTARGLAEGLERQEVVIDGTPCRVKVKDFVFLVEIDDLPGRRRLEDIAPVKSLIHVTEG